MNKLIAVMALTLTMSAGITTAQTSYPVGTTIEVTAAGIVVSAPSSSVDTNTGSNTNTNTGGNDTGGNDTGGNDTGGSDTETSGGTVVDTYEYCQDADYSLVDCDASRNYDPWIASTGEKHYWLRNQLTLSIPFTLPSRNDSEAQADLVRYGYFQMTAPERKRDQYKEDIFRVWFSEEPNGEPLEGKCEKWMLQARGYLYWSQDETLADQVCFLGHESRILYANFETACYAPTYEGSCSDTNKQKSSKSYQFDVARAVKPYK
jgi:hypothetical protein